MNIGVSFNETALLFLSLVSIIYFFRKRVNNYENRLYTGLITVGLFGNIIAIPLYFIVKYYKVYTIATFLIPRLYLVYLLIWTFLLSWYFFLITSSHNIERDFIKIKRIFSLYAIIVSIVTFLLKMEYYSIDNVVYTYGPSVNFTYLICGIHIVYWLVGFIINFKKLKNKKCIPIIAVFVLGTVTAIIQKIDPSIRLMTVTISFITTIMYFTIENPDLKMVNELYKNKNIMEQTYEDKSNFVFEITQEVKNPILNINNLCNEAKGSKKIKDYENTINQISAYAKQLEFVVNDILDVSTIDAQQIKFINNKYNLELIFNEVVNKVKGVLPSNVKFSYTISHNLPELYGDSIKLKQILTSLLLNSIKHTKAGFIDFNIDSIQRFDAVRLIISIKDSSSGLSLDKINDILSTTGSLDEKDIEAMNQSDMNMKECQKIMKLMGGNMLIRSGSEKGSEIILTLDQKIQINNTESILNKYEDSIKTGLNVAVVCQNKNIIKMLKSKINSKEIKSSFLMNGYDLIDEVKSGKVFDYIFVENEMKKINGYNIFNELNKIKGFTSKVVIMLDKDNMKLRKHFIDDGFNDVLVLDNLASEIDRIIEKL